jgi:hypothetical protein
MSGPRKTGSHSGAFSLDARKSMHVWKNWPVQTAWSSAMLRSHVLMAKRVLD